MGYLDFNQEKLLKDKDNPFAAPGAGVGGGGGVAGSQVPLSGQGGSGFAGGGAGASGQAGTGGASKGWTNIQTYLDANKGNQGTASALNKEVGGTFDQEKQKLTDSASQATAGAQKQVTDNKIGQDQASKLISDSASQYNYKGPQNEAYQQNTGKLKGSLSSQFKDPGTYGYGLGAQTQEYGKNLGSDAGFKAIINSLYNKSSGGTMSTGARALQSQIDQENPLIPQARENLLNRYSGLTGDVTKTVGDVNKSFSDAKSQFGADQKALKDYLSNQRLTNNAAVRSQWLDNVDTLDRFNRWATPADFSGSAHVFRPDVEGHPEFGGRSGDFNYKQNNIAKYTGVDPTLMNAQGVDKERNAYNTIEDIFGGSDFIGKDTPWSLGDADVTGLRDYAGLDESKMNDPQLPTSINLGVLHGSDFLRGGANPFATAPVPAPPPPVVALPGDPIEGPGRTGGGTIGSPGTGIVTGGSGGSTGGLPPVTGSAPIGEISGDTIPLGGYGHGGDGRPVVIQDPVETSDPNKHGTITNPVIYVPPAIDPVMPQPTNGILRRRY